MTQNLPPVSAMCLTYGRPHLLEEAIYSFLQQDYQGVKELIVLNDLDQQTLVFDHPEVKIINVPKRFRSLGEKRNACAALTSHDILFPWDDDDIHLPHRISFSIKHLDMKHEYFKPHKSLRLHNGVLNGPSIVGHHAMSCFTHRLFNRVNGYAHMGTYEDRSFESAVEKILGIYKNYTRMSLNDYYYLYRWGGTDSYHASWFDRDGNANLNEKVHGYVQNQLQNGSIRTGMIALQPRWRNNYSAMVADHISTLNQNAASAQLLPQGQKSGKVFGIGMPRSGTTSVSVALLELGFKTCHFCLDDYVFDRAEALLDTPVWGIYPSLDQRYPGSKFILTWRDPEKWYASFARTGLQHMKELRTTNLRAVHKDFEIWAQCFDTVLGEENDFTKDFIISRYYEHRRKAEEYFGDRPNDLLILDISGSSDPWQELCQFLGRPIPSTPFPNLNAGTQQRDWESIRHANKITYMDNRWLDWTRDNLDNGCNSEEILNTLLKQKFELADIRDAMGAKFPANSPLLKSVA